MSVIVTIGVNGDPGQLEEYANKHPQVMRAIADQALEHGLIAHRFYGADGGRLLVIDEWPDAESFQTFFDLAQGEIGPLLEAAGATSGPEVTFWRTLETHDEVGWD